MGAYLIDHPGRLRQYSVRTSWARSRPTGLVVLHTTEFQPSWTVQQQAAWIRQRSDPGSYHDIADTHGRDLQLVPYQYGAWQDGTGSNGFGTSISFVCRTTDWARMSPEVRRRTLRAGARCFVRQQAWLKANGHPTTPLRLLTKAQSDAGMAGFIYHGLRDPARRTDPGVRPPNVFPFAEWLDACRAELGTSPAPKPTPKPSGGFLMALSDAEQKRLLQNTDQLVTIFRNADQTADTGDKHGRAWQALVDMQAALATLTTDEHDSLALEGFTATIPGFVRYIDRHARIVRVEQVPQILAALDELKAAVAALAQAEPTEPPTA
jgi:hypothetical protein